MGNYERLGQLSVVGMYGAKKRFCKYINTLMPHDIEIYIEPFGGSASVLLNKPRHKTEIYNDISNSLCTMFRVLSSSDKADKFMICLYELEVNETVFQECKEYKHIEDKHLEHNYSKYSHLNKITDSELRLAVATYFIYTNSRNCVGVQYNPKYETRDKYLNHISKLNYAINRLRNVYVVSTPKHFREFKQYLDNPKVLMYCDPPYLRDTNAKSDENYAPGKHYSFNLTLQEHIELLKMIQLCKAKIIISNYIDCDKIYPQYLEEGKELSTENLKRFKSFKRIEIPTITTLSGKRENRVEVLWTNI